ncbi:MAG: hypothetical protein ACRDFW_01055 [bacterium]
MVTTASAKRLGFDAVVARTLMWVGYMDAGAVNLPELSIVPQL